MYKGTLSWLENFWYVRTAWFCIPNIYFLFWNSTRNTPKIRKNCQFLSRKVTKMASMAPKKSINSCQWLQNLEKIDVNDSANLEKNRVNDSRNWNKTVSTAPKSILVARTVCKLFSLWFKFLSFEWFLKLWSFVLRLDFKWKLQSLKDFSTFNLNTGQLCYKKYI